ncbi:hypothetical protein KIPB_012288, partial [Kipferlia bialata]
VRNNFVAYDRDRSGSISRQELVAVLGACRLLCSEQTLNTMYQAYASPNQQISYISFIALAADLAYNQTLFSWFDSDKDGKITYDQFLQMQAISK